MTDATITESETSRPRRTFASFVAAYMLNDMTRACRQHGREVLTCGITPQELGMLMSANYGGLIDRKAVREIVRDRLVFLHGEPTKKRKGGTDG